MSKVKKMEKIEMIIGSAVAANSYIEINEEDGKTVDTDVLSELNSHLVHMCVMFVTEYYTEGDVDKASAFMAGGASKALELAERRVKAKTDKPKNNRGFTEDELKEMLGDEAFAKFKAALKGDD